MRTRDPSVVAKEAIQAIDLAQRAYVAGHGAQVRMLCQNCRTFVGLMWPAHIGVALVLPCYACVRLSRFRVEAEGLRGELLPLDNGSGAAVVSASAHTTSRTALDNAK